MKGSVEHCKAFLLDWDGTLVKSLAIKIANAAEVISERFGADADAVSTAYSRHSGVPRRELFDRIAKDTIGRTLTDAEFDEVSPKFSALNRERIGAQASLRPGSLETIARMKEDDRLVFISTATAQDEIDPLAKNFRYRRLLHRNPGLQTRFHEGAGPCRPRFRRVWGAER